MTDARHPDALTGALESLAAIRDTLGRHYGGSNNPEALAEIDAALRDAELWPGAGHPLREKVGSFRGWAEMLFSDAGWEDHGTPDRVRGIVLQDLAGLEQIVRRG